MPIRQLLVTALAVSLVGCDLAEEDFQPKLVVSGVFTADGPMSTIELSQTAPIEDVYAFERYALSHASVHVDLLGDDGEPETSYAFEELADLPGGAGQYAPVVRPKPSVEPGRRYRLVVRFPSGTDGARLIPVGDSAWAETSVPDRFEIVCDDPGIPCLAPGAQPDPILYDTDAPSPAIDVTVSEGDRQSVYLFNIRSLEPDRYPLTPLAASFVEDGALDSTDLAVSSSPLLNEANYERNPDGTIRLRVPWFSIGHFGPAFFTVNTLDDALYDFLRSRDAQFNPTTLAPGEIQRVFSNVENGVGVFGSLSSAVTDTVFVQQMAP